MREENFPSAPMKSPDVGTSTAVIYWSIRDSRRKEVSLFCSI